MSTLGKASGRNVASRSFVVRSLCILHSRSTRPSKRLRPAQRGLRSACVPGNPAQISVAEAGPLCTVIGRFQFAVGSSEMSLSYE